MQFAAFEMESRLDSQSNAAVAEKVLRRAEIAQVARNLQDCLALANFKARNGWQDRTLSAIEPEVAEQIRRKRPFPSGDILSDSSSNASDSAPYTSSPLTGPMFSDDVVPGSSHSNRSKLGAPAHFPLQRTNSNKRLRTDSTGHKSLKPSRHVSWKSTHRLPQSSPGVRRPASSFKGHPSFVSDSATISLPAPDQSPLFSRSSDQTIADDDSDNDLPIHSFAQRPGSSSMISSSPPRTPPPTRHAKSAMGGTSKSGAAADLLLYLANSPSRSPAPNATNHFSPGDHTANPPSTPPTTSNLPSSILATPSNSHSLSTSLFNGALAVTPGNNSNFNFADFVNVTPSPAQVPWGSRTPAGPKTPSLAARMARRGLNFDALVPPGVEAGKSKEEKEGRGLALEFGEGLMPRR